MKSSAAIRFLLRTARQTAHWAVDLAFPPCCSFCGIDLAPVTAPPWLCQDCRESFCRLPGPLCLRCASPVHPHGIQASGQGSNRGNRCPRCHGRHYYFESAIALGIYQDALRLAIRRMKRPAFEQLTFAVGTLLGDCVARWTEAAPVDLVVPVPMHWTRRLMRGANTAETLSEAVARHLGVESRPRMVVSGRQTRKQGMLAPAQRFDNVRHAFYLAKGYDLAGARVLIVDDVMTTGATASEVARVLRRARAASVRVAVVGRGVGHG